LRRDRDVNIKGKACFVDFGQSECVYFTVQMKRLINKFLYKNMFPTLYKYVSVYIKYLHYIYVIQTART